MKGFQIFFTSGDVGAHMESIKSRDDNSSIETMRTVKRPC